MRINKGKLILSTIIMSIIIFASYIAVDFIRYPEQYSTTWKHQLELDLANGNEEAVEYYNSRYTANGKYLFGEK